LKDLSARETREAYLRQIERVNPPGNAIIARVAERATEQARQADEALAGGETPSPLHRLPIAHKYRQLTGGIRTTFGSRIHREFIPTSDSLLVERIRKVGAILLGRTNTAESGAGS
jgi:amidase